MTESRNPYVGPRAFEAADRVNFFGRDAEIRQLADLVVAQRAVLLYAPSGAGKSSLINAGLIPALERRRMTVLPVARVGGSAPPEARNPFVCNALAALLGETADLQALPALSLLDGLKLAAPLLGASEKPRPVLLALDQFEELFTFLPGRREAREDFFGQLQVALEACPHLGLLLAMREEYLAHLDSFRAMLPDRLRARFRLELLGEQAARLAIQAPARAQQVDFTDAAATKLVNDLRQVREQSLDGATETRMGEYVEPVQLQVVCRQVWERVMGAAVIQESDIAAVGDVDAALATYYSDTVAHIGGDTGAERALREWCQRLITPQGLRGIVQRDAGQSAGLDNALIAALEDAHLVRAEKRAGAAWYELAHDRLVAPVRDNNAQWFTEHLSLLQRQAALWDEQKRAAGLLLSGDALAKAEEWAKEHAGELTATERDFMAACRAAQAQAAREQQQTRRIRWLAVGATVLMLVAIAAAAFGWWQRNTALEAQAIAETRQIEAEDAKATAEARRVEAEDAKATAEARRIEAEDAKATAEARRVEAEDAKAMAEAEGERAKQQAKIALSRLLATNVPILVAKQPDLSLLLAAQSYQITSTFEAKNSLLIGLQNIDPIETILWGNPSTVRSVKFSKDGRFLAAGYVDGAIVLWDVAERSIIWAFNDNAGSIDNLDFSPDGKILASPGSRGAILLDTATGQPIGTPLMTNTCSVAFDPKGISHKLRVLRFCQGPF